MKGILKVKTIIIVVGFILFRLLLLNIILLVVICNCRLLDVQLALDHSSPLPRTNITPHKVESYSSINVKSTAKRGKIVYWEY